MSDELVMNLKKALYLIGSETSNEGLAILSSSLYKKFEDDDQALGEICCAIDLKKQELIK